MAARSQTKKEFLARDRVPFVRIQASYKRESSAGGAGFYTAIGFGLYVTGAQRRGVVERRGTRAGGRTGAAA